jgi:uncharacterized membrane protein
VSSEGAKVTPAASEEKTVLAHLYRGEMQRMTVWRQRLDVTSNWAIVLTTALTTFALGSAEVPHFVLLLGLSLIGISLVMEGRRYRHLHHSKWRLYLMEVGLFAETVRPSPKTKQLDWRDLLAEDLRRPRFTISWPLAVRVRLRRNYLLLVYFISAVWIAKAFMHPARATSWHELYGRLHVGDFVPSWVVVVSALGFVALATLAATTCPVAERLEDWSPGDVPSPG